MAKKNVTEVKVGKVTVKNNPKSDEKPIVTGMRTKTKLGGKIREVEARGATRIAKRKAPP